MFFAIHHHESAMDAHVSPILKRLLPPPPPHPSGLSREPALSALLHALNLHWSSILHMVIYMFHCYSLKSSHPHLLPHSPKICSLHLCLFCCLAYRIVIAIFLNSIYIWVNIEYWYIWLTSLCIIGSSFTHLIRTDSNMFLMAE